jgi:hypothetical protein
VSATLLQACASPERLEQPPVDRFTHAVVQHTPNARFHPHYGVNAISEEALRSIEREVHALGLSSPSELPPANFLAISGGADDGAFGAGEFNPVYMQALFDSGYAKSKKGYDWSKSPPGAPAKP